MAQSGVDSASTSGLTSVTGYSSYATMKSKLKTILANKTVYGGESVTAANKRYFLWGMAMHSAADSFAHCAYIKSGSTYVHILHADGADDNGVYPSRFTAAKKVVSNVIARYISSTTASSSGERTPISGKAGTYSEYVLADSYFKDNGVFSYRLRHLTKFMTEVGNTNTSVFANQSY